MRYLIGAIVIIFAGLTMSGSVETQEPAEFTYPAMSYVACEAGTEEGCIEFITFPVMRVEAGKIYSDSGK